MMNPSDPKPEDAKIIHKATRGMAWNYLTFGLSKSINLITVSVLAHILSPGIIGVAVLATLAIDYVSILNNLGLGAAIIQRKEKSDEVSSTAFTLNLILGLILTTTTILFIAPLAASFFTEPMVSPVLQTLGVIFTINTLGSVHAALIQKDLDFQRRLVVEIGNSFVKAVVSISLAYAGFEVWALVYGQIAGAATSVALLWIVNPWRPRFAINWEIAKGLFKYGSSIMGVNAFSVLQDNFDYLIIGALYSTATLGIYTYAYRLPELLVINVLWVMTGVLFPAFSSIQDNREVLKRSFLSIVHYVGLLVTPICLGLFIAAEHIVRVLFGEQWLGVIPILRVLSAYAWIHSIGFHAGDIYKAIGRPDILVKTVVPIFVIRVALLWLGAQYGLIWVATAHLITGIISLIIRVLMISRILKITVREIFGQLTAVKAGLVLTVFVISSIFLTTSLVEQIRLVIIIGAGGMGYLIGIWKTERDFAQNFLRILGFDTSRVAKNEAES